MARWLDDAGLPKIGGLKDVPTKVGKLEFASEIKPVEPIHTGGVVNLDSDELTALTRTLGSDSKARRLARRVLRLKQQYPRGSTPELVAIDWMQRRGHWFVYQAPLLGGRASKGGSVADLVTQSGGKGIIIRVQGDYWHSLRAQAQRDAVAKVTLIGSSYGNLRISYVVDAWEGRIYKNPDFVFTQALMGVEVGR